MAGSFAVLGAPSLGLVGVAVGAGLCAFIAAYLVMAVPRGALLRRQLEAHVAASPAQIGRREARGSVLLPRLFAATEKAFGERRFWKSVALMLARADVSLQPAEFVCASLGLAIVLAVLSSLAGLPGLVTVLAILLAALGPYAVLSIRATRRLRALELQLPDTLTTMAALLQAGHSLRQGLHSVANDAQPPISTEFRHVLSEVDLGLPLDEALLKMGQRIASSELTFVIAAITIQREVGGSLANFFQLISEVVRERHQFRLRVRSLTATGRASANVLIIMPFAIGLLLTVANPTYMHPLYHTTAGHILLGLALGMLAVGALIIRKIASFQG